MPCNNTLSHISKCLALREVLVARGHEVLIAVSASRAAFVARAGVEPLLLPDIQEADNGPSPTFAWFKPARVDACIRAEVELIRRVRPDAVLGVFRFTGSLSAALAGVPYDSLVCGCMTPACDEVLGFAPDEPEADAQARSIAFFRAACARRMAPALRELGLAPVADAWHLLAGRRTFLWDFVEFQPLPAAPGYYHIGPVRWSCWPLQGFDERALAALRAPLAIVAFGTGRVRGSVVQFLVGLLHHMGFSVALALGGQRNLGDLPRPGPRLAIFDFLPMQLALPHATVVLCHGGQGIVFEAIEHALPVLVLPFQPEQAQNGRCLERLGCGLRMARGVVFRGDSAAASEALLTRPPQAIRDDIAAFLGDAQTPIRLAEAARAIARYDGIATLVRHLEAMD